MTDKVEFYPTIDINEKDLSDRVEQWQFDYNWHRPHSSLNNKTPLEKVYELSDKTPVQNAVTSAYNSLKERIQERHYQTDLLARKLK